MRQLKDWVPLWEGTDFESQIANRKFRQTRRVSVLHCGRGLPQSKTCRQIARLVDRL